MNSAPPLLHEPLTGVFRSPAANRCHGAGLSVIIAMLSGSILHAADVAGNHITYITPKLHGYDLDIAAIHNAASGHGYVATSTYKLNDDVFDFIVKLNPGGSLEW